MAKMKRLVKLEGGRNVAMAEADIPMPGPTEALVKVKRSLISRGSELFRRYVMEEAVPPDMMGYSDAGEIVGVGAEVEGVEPGQRSNLGGPHAEYAVGEPFIIPDEMDYETATFIGLSTSALRWARRTPIEPGDDVVVLGQGIVGNLYSQAVRERQPGRVITVDALDLRCRVSRECGADVVIDVSEKDSVEAVMELTNGEGSNVVVDCVGSNAGIKSFEQAQRMVKSDGVIHLIARYQGSMKPGDGLVTLDTSLIRETMIIGGLGAEDSRRDARKDAAQALLDGRINARPLITHRLPGMQADEAYHFLYEKPDEALAVVLEWD